MVSCGDGRISTHVFGAKYTEGLETFRSMSRACYAVFAWSTPVCTDRELAADARRTAGSKHPTRKPQTFELLMCAAPRIHLHVPPRWSLLLLAGTVGCPSPGVDGRLLPRGIGLWDPSLFHFRTGGNSSPPAGCRTNRPGHHLNGGKARKELARTVQGPSCLLRGLDIMRATRRQRVSPPLQHAGCS